MDLYVETVMRLSVQLSASLSITDFSSVKYKFTLRHIASNIILFYFTYRYPVLESQYLFVILSFTKTILANQKAGCKNRRLPSSFFPYFCTGARRGLTSKSSRKCDPLLNSALTWNCFPLSGWTDPLVPFYSVQLYALVVLKHIDTLLHHTYYWNWP